MLSKCPRAVLKETCLHHTRIIQRHPTHETRFSGKESKVTWCPPRQRWHQSPNPTSHCHLSLVSEGRRHIPFFVDAHRTPLLPGVQRRCEKNMELMMSRTAPKAVFYSQALLQTFGENTSELLSPSCAKRPRVHSPTNWVSNCVAAHEHEKTSSGVATLCHRGMAAQNCMSHRRFATGTASRATIHLAELAAPCR